MNGLRKSQSCGFTFQNEFGLVSTKFWWPISAGFFFWLVQHPIFGSAQCQFRPFVSLNFVFQANFKRSSPISFKFQPIFLSTFEPFFSNEFWPSKRSICFQFRLIILFNFSTNSNWMSTNFNHSKNKPILAAFRIISNQMLINFDHTKKPILLHFQTKCWPILTTP